MATSTGPYLTVIALLIATAASDTTPTTYTNHTVGGSSGWFFNTTTNTSSTNFSSWAASQTFYLGDYLIFDTSTNQTVFQTYNQSTYLSCNTDDSSDNDTFQFDGGSNQFDQATIVPVPLTIVGIQYYFSDADDGVQCQNGMAFEINVSHGLGLPPSLNQPPPPPYVEPPSTVEAGQSPPVTVVNQPNSGGKSSANVRRVIWVVLLLGGALVLG